jgi:hypothetical protein
MVQVCYCLEYAEEPFTDSQGVTATGKRRHRGMGTASPTAIRFVKNIRFQAPGRPAIDRNSCARVTVAIRVA